MRLNVNVLLATVASTCFFLSIPRCVADDNTPAQQRAPKEAETPLYSLETLDAAERRELAKKHGGNDASEAAVASALKWIASRQSSDGGWNFNHNESISEFDCPDPGTIDKARNAATGLALLSFLGASQTHKQGKYKEEVHSGLSYLIENLKVGDNRGSWHEPQGSMYGHGYAAMAMCDAFSRTRDMKLQEPAQLAVNFIVFAQDPVGGGWRYHPKQAGDTSVSSVQLLTLHHAHDAWLEVPKGTILGMTKFLDSAKGRESGSTYGYTGPGAGKCTTAMALRCRTHLGWKRDHEGLREGVAFLEEHGPSPSDMYFNYYATQLMFQYGGEPWKRWNAKLRDTLVESQSKEGVTAGSWFFKGGDHGSIRGGRLYCTALACLILEVYYREGRAFDRLKPM